MAMQARAVPHTFQPMKNTVDTKTIGRNEPCWCGSGLKYKKCHLTKDRAAPPRQAVNPFMPAPGRAPNSTLIKTPEQIEGIREACQLNRRILDMVGERVEAGVTTNDIDRWVHEFTEAHGARPAPLNYKNFPKSVCTSINEVVCHGIPDERVLEDGDIINVDASTILNGYFGDSSRMFQIGNVSQEARDLVRVTQECLEVGISQVHPGGFVGDIGHAIQTHAQQHGYSVVRDFVGHGTGCRFHEEPQIPHFGQRGRGHPLLPGMVFTIEPMINAGGWPIRILADRWTAVTRDGSLSAQWEHTITVTNDGVEILTA